MRMAGLSSLITPIPEWQKMNSRPRLSRFVGASGVDLCRWCQMAKRRAKPGRDSKGRITKSKAGRALARRMGKLGHYRSCKGRKGMKR